jgi:diguanylate cyclase (GGDEF)-like protein
VRNSDAVCRIGGEEFMIILPFQTTVEAELCANRCLTAVAEREFNYQGQILRTTLSAGVGCRRGEMLCCADLLEQADTALYLAKRAGRNMVQSMRNPPESIPPADTFAA